MAIRFPTLVVCLLLTSILMPAAAASTPVPVVVAVDTSRSLDRAALGEVVDRLRLALQDLPPDTPTGLVAFDDSPRWLLEVGASPSDVANALQDLILQGSFTLLHDALFVATRDLEGGGVVLLATDGRDENSATTVDDIARRCEAEGVRILSVGTGNVVAERALRRLAMISNGRYLGDVRTVDAGEVAGAIAEARAAVEAERIEAAMAARPSGPAAGDPGTGDEDSAARPAAQPPAGTAAGESAAISWLRALLPWIITGLSILLVMVLVLSSRKSSRRSARAKGDDVESLDQEAEDERLEDVAEAEVIKLELAQVPMADPREAPEVTVNTTVFQQMSLDERLEHTRVLSNDGVLLMRRMGESPRSFALDRTKAFAVGRDKDKNTLAVPDPSISSQHFKIVPKDDAYYFVDLDSTNGSYIGGRKVNAKRLRSGDQIRAGQVEFEFQNYRNV